MELQIKKLRLGTPALNLNATGVARFGENRHSLWPDHLTLDYRLDATTDHTPFPITPEFGSFSMRDVQLDGSVTLNPAPEISVHNLLMADGETKFTLSRPQLHPSEHIMSEYAMLTRAFGLDLESLEANRMSGLYRLDNHDLTIESIELESPFFNAELWAEVELDPEDRRDSFIHSGRLEIADMTSGVAVFFREIEQMFQIEFQRDDEDIQIFFHGPVGSPRLSEIPTE